MSLNSASFIFGMFPILVLLYYSVPKLTGKHRAPSQKIILLVASLLFFAWVSRQYLPFLCIIILINWLLAQWIGKSRISIAKAFLTLGVVVDVLSLLYYKYFDFFGSQIASLFNFEYVDMGIIQPLGISFLTFSLISYLVDVYRKDIEADKNILNVFLWASFFPKLTSGPIARYDDMYSPENIEKAGKFELDTVAYGARRFAIGLAKKVIIADILGLTVDEIFTAQVAGIDTATAWLGIICYTLQIFFDFAGYSDMALGLAALFGYRLRENFNYPYISKTVGEFWRRWHISLSSWLRDYIYFPLGGSRRGNVYVNLTIVFLVSGLWHGASWHFIAWGLWYGIFMILDRIYREHAEKLKVPSVVLWFATISVVVLGWVFFRSSGMTQAISYLGVLFGVGSVGTQFFGFGYYLNNRVIFLIVVGILCSTPLFARMAQRFEGTVQWEVLRAVSIPLLFIISIVFMVNSNYSPFLYAQF